MTELPFTHIIPGMASSELVLVEGGTFRMGSNEDDWEKPIHKVTVPSFAIGKFPVTQELWMAVMGENPSRFIDRLRPIECVSWEETQVFFQKINQDAHLSRGQVFRLPRGGVGVRSPGRHQTGRFSLCRRRQTGRSGLVQ